MEAGSLADNRRLQQSFFFLKQRSTKWISCHQGNATSVMLIFPVPNYIMRQRHVGPSAPPPAWVLSACSALNIPPLSRSIWCLSVKVVSNSYHHKRMGANGKNNHRWHSWDIPPERIASGWKNVIACFWKRTQLLCHAGITALTVHVSERQRMSRRRCCQAAS